MTHKIKCTNKNCSSTEFNILIDFNFKNQLCVTCTECNEQRIIVITTILDPLKL